MAALITKITTFFSGVMTMVTGGTIGSGESAVTVTGLTDTIVGSDLLVLGVIAVPLVGISVGLLSRLFSGFSLYRLPQREDHAAQNDRHDVAAQDHARHSDGHSDQGEESAGQFAAPVPAQLLRERRVCHVSVFFFHTFLLIPPRRSEPGSP